MTLSHSEDPYAPEHPGRPEECHALNVSTALTGVIQFVFIVLAALVALYGATLQEGISAPLTNMGAGWLVEPFFVFEFGPETSMLSMVLSSGVAGAMFVLLALLTLVQLVVCLASAASLRAAEAQSPVRRSDYARAVLSTMRQFKRLNLLLLLNVVLLSPFALGVLPVLIMFLALHSLTSSITRLAYKLRGPAPMMQP